MTSIDLNCDFGEDEHTDYEREEELLRYVSSVNIACGAHAGNETTMRRCVLLAKAQSAAIGAHFGYEDRLHFGRRELALPLAEIERLVTEQVSRLQKIVIEEGARLVHCKPHGALYHRATSDAATAKAIVQAALSVQADLAFIGRGCLFDAALAAGVPAWEEGFIDRTYEADGSLTPRELAGAVIEDPEEAAQRAQAILFLQELVSRTGETVEINAQTLCIHGDAPQAVAVAAAVRETLELCGVDVRSPAAR